MRRNNYKKSQSGNTGGWSTVSRKRSRRGDPDTWSASPREEKKEHSKNEFYQEDRKWSRSRVFNPNSNRRERKQDEPDFPILVNGQVSTPVSITSVSKWVNLINKDQDDDNTVSTTQKNTDNGTNADVFPYPCPRIRRNRKIVINQVPKPNYNLSHGAWELTYFSHILELHDIFTRGIKKLGFGDLGLDSFEFLEVFSHFIKDSSSGKISPFVDSVGEGTNSNLEDLYFEYMVKRNNI